MHRRTLLSLTLALMCVGAVIAAASAALAQDRARMVTAPPGSAGYAISAAIAKVAGEKSNLTIDLIPITGSGAILDILSKGEADLGWMTTVDSYMGYHGVRPFPQAYPNMRLVAMGSLSRVAAFVRADSDIRTLADLKGKRVTGVYSGSPISALVSQVLLAAGGLTNADVTIVPVATPTAGVQALKERRADAAMVVAINAPDLREADAAVGIRALSVSMSPQAMQVALKLAPDLQLLPAGKGNYVGVTEDMTLLSYPTGIIATEKTAPDVVKKFLSALWNNSEELGSIHPQLKEWTRQALPGPANNVPFHSAAVDFFKAQGAWSAERDKKQAELLKK